jgi:hypothetical protein
VRSPEAYRCDGQLCEQTKGDTNHWWKLYVYENRTAGFLVIPWATPPFSGLRQDLKAERCIELHLCGEACLQKKISEALSAPQGGERRPTDARS